MVYYDFGDIEDVGTAGKWAGKLIFHFLDIMDPVAPSPMRARKDNLPEVGKLYPLQGNKGGGLHVTRKHTPAHLRVSSTYQLNFALVYTKNDILTNHLNVRG